MRRVQQDVSASVARHPDVAVPAVVAAASRSSEARRPRDAARASRQRVRADGALERRAARGRDAGRRSRAGLVAASPRGHRRAAPRPSAARLRPLRPAPRRGSSRACPRARARASSGPPVEPEGRPVPEHRSPGFSMHLVGADRRRDAVHLEDPAARPAGRKRPIWSTYGPKLAVCNVVVELAGGLADSSASSAFGTFTESDAARSSRRSSASCLRRARARCTARAAGTTSSAHERRRREPRTP